jgi:hypothetical protein
MTSATGFSVTQIQPLPATPSIKGIYGDENSSEHFSVSVTRPLKPVVLPPAFFQSSLGTFPSEKRMLVREHFPNLL